MDKAAQQKIYTTSINGRPYVEFGSGYNTPYGYSEVDYAGLGKQALSSLDYLKGQIDLFTNRYGANSSGAGSNTLDLKKQYNDLGGDTVYNQLKSGNYDVNTIAKIFPNLDTTQLQSFSQGQPVASDYVMWNGAFVKKDQVPALESSGATVKDGQVVGPPIKFATPPAGALPGPQAIAEANKNPPVQNNQTAVPNIIANGNLQVGSKGAQVSELQKSLGITTDGDFGAKTQSAVKAFQAANSLTVDGIVGPETAAALTKVKGTTISPTTTTTPPTTQKAPDDSSNKYNTQTGALNPNYKETSTITKPPSTGNTQIDSLISAFNNQSPQKSFTDVYKEVYTSLGLDTLKTDYVAQTKAYSDLQEEKNKEKQDINNNPWYSEGVRINKLKQLDNKYEGKETILSNKLKLLESNISTGSADAKFVAGQVMDQLQQSSKLTEDIIFKAIDIAEKQAEAETKSSTPKKVTIADSVQNFSNFLKTGKDSAGTKFGNPQGADGYVDPQVYITAFQNWPGTSAEFLSKFPVKTYVNPLSYKLLPASIQPKTSSSDTNISDEEFLKALES